VRRRTIVAIAALALAVAGCSGGRVTRRAAAAESRHRALRVSRFELDDRSMLHGEPEGFAVDRLGSIVNVDEEKVVALDPQGAEQWSTRVVGAAYGWPWLGRGVAVVPTMSAGRLHNDEAGPGGCVALDRASGAVRWAYEEQGRSGVAVAGLDDRAYCVFGDGTMAAINIDTGELAWRAVVDERPRPAEVEVSERTALVIDGSTHTLAFTALWGPHQYLFLRDLSTGVESGAFDLGAEFSSAPVSIGPGNLAFGQGLGYACRVDLRRLVRLPCLELQAPDGFDPASVPFVVDGTLVVAGRDGSVSAVDFEHGKVRWTTKLDTAFLDAKPVVAGGVVVVADGIRTPWALRVSDGSRVDAPSIEGFVVSTAVDPGGGVAVAVRAELSGEIQRWIPSG
jgi:outer membrane protein assembly factor BamB